MTEDAPLGVELTAIASRLYAFLFPVPVVCFFGALMTDIAYTESAFLMWLHFSEWLIAAGLAFGAVAALALLVAFLSSSLPRKALGWTHLMLFYAALAVELFNAFVHTIDGWTAVVPTGIALSVVGSAFALAAAGVLFHAPLVHASYLEARA